MLYIISFLRANHSTHDFADHWERNPKYSSRELIQTKGQEGKRIWGRPFITAGWIVLAVAVVVAVVEVGLFILILRL